MQKLNFTNFSSNVEEQFTKLCKQKDTVLVRANITGDALWDIYLNSYPEEVNGIFRERKEYDGNYDKSFIRRLGNLVAVHKDGTVDTIWNVTVNGYFQQVADACHKAVLKSGLKEIFFTTEPQAGSRPNKDNTSDIIWTHFFCKVPSTFVLCKEVLPTKAGEINTNIQMLERGLSTFTLSALDIVAELISSNSLYRGSEFKKAVTDFRKYKVKYEGLSEELKRPFIFYTAITVGMPVRFRNSAIGTLVEDLSNCVELEKAVASFESKVAPQNYKRTTSLATPAMIKKASETIQELGLLESLDRRFAKIVDIPTNEVLFTSQLLKPLNVLEDLLQDSSRKVGKLDKVEQISLADFVKNVLPTASKVEALVEGKHSNNFMSVLTATYPSSPSLFKWNNTFSWSYNGNITDAIQERVKKFGGDIEGDLRISLSWYNADDLDLSLVSPKGQVIKYSDKRGIPGGLLDLDMNGIDKHSATEPVENIIFKNKKDMLKGDYRVVVNQFSQRSTKDVGFTLQVEADGVVTNYTHELVFKGSFQHILTVHFDGNGFTIKNVNPIVKESQGSSKEIWNTKTNEFVPVLYIMNSPNHWEGESVGNKHTFFILENCKTEDETRGFYNEFLRSDLEVHRKTLELLGTKTAVTPNGEEQVSGLGFSETVRNTLTVRVTGKTTRTFLINF